MLLVSIVSRPPFGIASRAFTTRFIITWPIRWGFALTRARLGKDRPLIGINGAKDGLDIARMMLAGASAVGLASAVMLRGFEVISKSLDELDGFLAAKGITAADLVGRAADSRKTFADMPLRHDHWRGFVPR